MTQFLLHWPLFSANPPSTPKHSIIIYWKFVDIRHVWRVFCKGVFSDYMLYPVSYWWSAPLRKWQGDDKNEVQEPPRTLERRSISPTTAVSAGVSAKREKQGYFRLECSAVAVGSTVLHVCVDVLWEMRSCWFFLSRLVQLNTLASTLFYRVSAGMREDLQSSIRHTSSDHFSESYLLSL